MPLILASSGCCLKSYPRHNIVFVIFRQIRDLLGKKQRRPNLIRSEDKNTIKDKFLDSGKIKRRKTTPADKNFSSEREGGETRNHASPILTFLFSALKEVAKS